MVKHADTSLWLPAAKRLHARQFLQYVSDFVKAKLLLRTFKNKRETYSLSMSGHSSHSTGSGKRRKHVMTNKQHTKFHISYIKDQTCRHKSMDASC